jgi:D-arabinose 1-dehydrogenase-like Zn-dependent alcohol dehydrogenase
VAARHLRPLPVVPQRSENLCPDARFTGWDADGGYAEYAVVPEAFATGCPRRSATARRLRCCVPASWVTAR